MLVLRLFGRRSASAEDVLVEELGEVVVAGVTTCRRRNEVKWVKM